MPIRLLAIDIDGTLLTRERTPHPENIRAVRRAMDAGITVVPASGRIAASITQFSNQLGTGSAMICSNGSHVLGPDGDELLYIELAEEAIDRTLAYTGLVGVHTSAYTRYELFFLFDSAWGAVYKRRVRTVTPQMATPDSLRGIGVQKLILIDEPSKISGHRRALEQVLPADLAFLTESEPEYLEVLSPSANKGVGLKVLSEAMGIPRHETAAIGDYLNDVEMVAWAGIGGAVANAVDAVKAAADVHVASNDAAGVAQFIEHLLELNERDAAPVAG